MLDNKFLNLIENVISPFLLSFIKWVVDDAKKKGIERLYFVARDGQILHKIAKACFSDEVSVEFDYLFGSRQAWYPLMVENLDISELDWLVFKHLSKTPRDLLKRLGEAPENFQDSLQSFGFPESNWDYQLDEKRYEEFWKFLAYPKVRNPILNKIKNKQKEAGKYFKQKGLFDGKKWAVVDTGWTLRSQFALNKALGRMNCPQNAKGYYIGVGSDHIKKDLAGEYWGWFEQNGSWAEDSKMSNAWMFYQGVSFVLEEVFLMSDQLPTQSYYSDNEGVSYPQFKEENNEAIDSGFVQEYHNTCVNFCKSQFNKNKSKLEWDRFKRKAVKSAKQFLLSPRQSQISSIQWIPVNYDQTHESHLKRTLAHPLTLQDIARLILYVLGGEKGRFEDNEHAWYMGSAAISSWQVRCIFYFIRNYWTLKNMLRNYGRKS